jgi:hypothetical protein
MREEMRTHLELAELARRQYGVVSTRQLRRLGYSASAVGRAQRSGRLHRVHRGVYAVGHRSLTRHGLCLAAIMACGPHTVVSHRSAAWLWGIGASFPRRVEVTVPLSGHKRDDIRVHRRGAFAAEDRTRHERIPVTSLPQTLLDLAATTRRRPRQLTAAVERGERLGLLNLDAIDEILARHRGDPGTVALTEATEIYRAPVFSRARSERLFLALVADTGLPRPALNTWVEGFEVDAYWAEERFAVEVDGWETHRTRKAFEDDRVRQEDLKLAGVESVLITARRIERQPALVGERLRAHLDRRRAELRQLAQGGG